MSLAPMVFTMTAPAPIIPTPVDNHCLPDYRSAFMVNYNIISIT